MGRVMGREKEIERDREGDGEREGDRESDGEREGDRERRRTCSPCMRTTAIGTDLCHISTD